MSTYTSSSYKIHRIRFVEYLPKPINCVAFDNGSDFPKCAISREDGTIEIRDPKSNWAVDKVIPGQDGRTVEHLAWCKGRLFSAGLNGEIIEWDQEKLQPKYNQDSYGGPVWCLRFNNRKDFLAVGCEDGSIRIFDVLHESILYQRSLHKQEHRILSIGWSHDDAILVSGSFDGTLRVYNVESGTIVYRMTTEYTHGKVMIWSIEVLADMTVVTGDSLGNTQFWDGITGTLTQTIKSHTADILSVVVTDDGKKIYTSGVDSEVVEFTFVQSNYAKWERTGSIRGSNHDTRTLAICGNPYNCVVSGGVDPRIVVHSLYDFTIRSTKKYSCLPPTQVCQLSPAANLLSFREQHKIHIWKLEELSDGAQRDGAVKKICEINFDCADHLISSSISKCGNYIAYSTIFRAKLIKVNSEFDPCVLSKVPVHLGGLSVFAFTDDSRYLIGASLTHCFNVVNLETKSVKVISIPLHEGINLPFQHLKVSADNRYISLVDSFSNCFLFTFDDIKQNITYKTKVPLSTDCKIASCTFHPENNNILIGTLGNTYEFDHNNEKFRELQMENKFLGTLKTLAFNPTSSDELFVQYGDKGFGKLKYKEVLDTGTRMRKLASDDPCHNSFIRCEEVFTDMVMLEFNAKGEMVIVERPVSDILKTLPAPLERKKFWE